MNGILAAMAALSVVFAAFQGKMDAVSSAALSEGVRAVELILTLVAASVAYYAMWTLAIVVFALAVYYTVKQL